MSSLTFVALLSLVVLASAAPQQRVEALAVAAPPAVAVAAPPAVDICLLAPLTDPTARCNDFSLKYYYDARTRDCEKIIYSGCGGSENLFATEDACEYQCEDPHDRLNSFESVEVFDFDK